MEKVSFSSSSGLLGGVGDHAGKCDRGDRSDPADSDSSAALVAKGSLLSTATSSLC